MPRSKTVVALHDIVGLGRCSLTMAIPVLAAMGSLSVPVPTAVFSAHTQYPNFVKQSLDDFLKKTLDAYVQEGIEFDAVYSGYLGDAAQIDIIKDFMRSQKGLRVVDPVFGDHGALYPSITMDMVRGFRDLIHYADIITPNLTEAAFLLERDPVDCLSADQEQPWLDALKGFGPRNVLITSCQREGEEDSIAVLGLDQQGNRFRIVSPLLPIQFHGNGDLFGSVLVGGLMNGLSLREAARQAAGFIYMTMQETIAAQAPVIEGVRIEKALHLLYEPQDYPMVAVQDIERA